MAILSKHAMEARRLIGETLPPRGMTHNEILARLCAYDVRNPDVVLDYSEKVEGEPFPKPEPCSCDNCFYGRDALAREILRLKDIIVRDAVRPRT